MLLTRRKQQENSRVRQTRSSMEGQEGFLQIRQTRPSTNGWEDSSQILQTGSSTNGWEDSSQILQTGSSTNGWEDSFQILQARSSTRRTHSPCFANLEDEVDALIIHYRIAWCRWAVALTQEPRLRTYRYHNDGHDPTESSRRLYESIDIGYTWIDPRKEWVDPVVLFIDAVFSIPDMWWVKQQIPLSTRGRLIIELAANPRYQPDVNDEPLATDYQLIKLAAGIADDHFSDCRDSKMLPPREERSYRVQLMLDAQQISDKFFTNHRGAVSKRTTGCPLHLKNVMVFADRKWIRQISKLPAQYHFFSDNEGLRRLCWLLTKPDIALTETSTMLEVYRPIIKGQFGMEPEALAKLYDPHGKDVGLEEWTTSKKAKENLPLEQQYVTNRHLRCC